MKRVAALACAGAALLAGLTGCASGPKPTAPAAAALPSVPPTPSPSPSQLVAPAGASLVATARTAHVWIAQTPGGRARWRLSNPNELGAPLVFLVIGSQPGWWQVRVPVRPNESVGWVPAGQLHVGIDPYAVTASVHRRVATVSRYGRVVWRVRIAVGAPSAPTPTGRFYLTELLRAPNPSGPYGPYAYGTSAFSDVYSEFEGGNGQIGVHGTNDPWSIGRNVSHGCIRLRNADIVHLAHLVPAGTPLTVER